MSTVVERLAAKGITLPPAPTPVANYVPYVVSGNLVHISGQLSGTAPNFVSGTVTERGDAEVAGTISMEKAKEGAQSAIINFLAQLNAAVGGDLSKVTRIVKINVFVNSHPSFSKQPVVANAASDLLVEAFGEEVGKHARAAVGVAALPLGVAVEIDGIVEVKFSKL